MRSDEEHQYTREFKLEVVRLSDHTGASVALVACDLGGTTFRRGIP